MSKIERTKEVVELWNVCTCGRTLHSISEGKRGLCASCWIASMPQDTKSALNNLIAAGFKKVTEKEKSDLVNDAFSKLRRDESE